MLSGHTCANRDSSNSTPRTPPASRQGELQLNGFRYCYAVTGESHEMTPVVLVSGAFQSMKSWSKFVAGLAEHMPVVTVDLPGGSSADLLPESYGIDFLVEALVQVLDTLAMPVVNLVAASYGTPIAYRLAQRHPERILRMVLAGVMQEIPDVHRPSIVATLETLAVGNGPKFARQVADGLMNQDPANRINRRRLTEKLLTAQLLRMSSTDVDKYVQNTRRLLNGVQLDLDDAPETPTLVFTGEHDTFTTPGLCQQIAAALPESYFTTISDADHLFHLEQFEITFELIRAFVADGRVEELAGCTAVQRSHRQLH